MPQEGLSDCQQHDRLSDRANAHACVTQSAAYYEYVVQPFLTDDNLLPDVNRQFLRNCSRSRND